MFERKQDLCGFKVSRYLLTTKGKIKNLQWRNSLDVTLTKLSKLVLPKIIHQHYELLDMMH